MLRLCLFLIIFVTFSNGQIIQNGTCPTVTPMANFDPAKFAGTWYTIKQYPTVYETISRCPTIKYELGSDGQFRITQNEILLTNNAPLSWVGRGKFPDSTIGQWNWNIPYIPIDIPSVPYKVLDTDYNGYATVYSCIQFGNVHLSFLWIQTKAYPLFTNGNAINSALAAAESQGLSTQFLTPAIQLLCPLPSINIFNLGSLFG